MRSTILGPPRALWRVAALTALLVCATTADAQGPRPSRPVRSMPSRASQPTIPAGYFHIVRAWHTPTPGKKPPLDCGGRPMLVLHAMYIDETVTLPAWNERGGFWPSDLALAAHALREPATGNVHPIDSGTIDLLYRIQSHFGAQEIRVMSAYRTPTAKSTQGLHGKGRAVDFVVPGVEDIDVARFAREQGFVGVGVYPVGSFVHVDVRERSYFWMDRSGPGHRSRERGILLDVARHSDEAALARGQRPPLPFGVANPDGSATDTDEDEDVAP